MYDTIGFLWIIFPNLKYLSFNDIMRVLRLFFEPRYSEPTILAYLISFELAGKVNIVYAASIA